MYFVYKDLYKYNILNEILVSHTLIQENTAYVIPK